MKALLGVILVLLIGCSGVVQAQGEADSQIEELTQRVESLEADSNLMRQRIFQLESDPLVQRMRRQAITQELAAEATAIARIVGPTDITSAGLGFLVEQVKLYGPPYIAWRCLEGLEPSVADYRGMVTATYADGVGPGGAAQWAIQLVVHEIKRLKSSNEEPSSCLKSYLYPESTADAAPAIELYLSAVIPSLPARFKDGMESLAVGRAGDWLNNTDRQQPFLIWMCGSSSDNPCGLPVQESPPKE